MGWPVRQGSQAGANPASAVRCAGALRRWSEARRRAGFEATLGVLSRHHFRRLAWRRWGAAAAARGVQEKAVLMGVRALRCQSIGVWKRQAEVLRRRLDASTRGEWSRLMAGWAALVAARRWGRWTGLASTQLRRSSLGHALGRWSRVAKLAWAVAVRQRALFDAAAAVCMCGNRQVWGS